MENNEIKGKIQIFDNYVNKFAMNTTRKITQKNKLEIAEKISMKVVKITENENGMVGQLELKNDLDLIDNKENIGKIEISMMALFSTQGISTEEFEMLLKSDGATTVSHLIRAYVVSATSLSGITPIFTPMINFSAFPKKEEK